jgi:hypothetical protein
MKNIDLYSVSLTEIMIITRINNGRCSVETENVENFWIAVHQNVA